MFDNLLRAWNRIIAEEQNVHASGNALHVLDEEDAAIHEGYGFHYGERLVIAPSGQVVLAGKTGARRVHFQGLDIEALTGPIEIDFRRGCQVASGSGTERMTHNRRFDITSGSMFKVYATPTVTNSGELVVPTANLATAGIGGKSTPAGGNAFFHGFVLAENTTALLFLRNTSVDTATLWANFTFHEPPNL